MRIKIIQNLISINGIDPIIDNGAVLTLKDVCVAAVLTPVQEDDFKKKMEKYEIFKKFRDAVEDSIELSAEEISIVKAASGKIHPPLVYGQCCEMLENR
jgi:hypothetical protein